MRRRELLGLAAAGMAGCAGVSRPTRTLPTPLDESPNKSFGKEATVGQTTVTVWDAEVQTSERYTTSDNHLDVYSPDGKYLVFVRLTASQTGRPPRSAFTLKHAGTTYSPLSDLGGVDLTAVQRRYGRYASEAPSSADGRWVVFEVPGGTQSDSTTFVWTPEDASPTAWDLREKQRLELAQPTPSFSLSSFELPSSAPVGGSPTATITVSNDSDTDGTFRAALNYSGGLSAAEDVTFSVPGGETTTVERDIPWTGQETTVELAWGGSNRSVTITPESG